MRFPIVLALVFSFVLTACGAAEPRAEATWETHTTAPDDGGEPAEEDDAAE